MSLRSVGTGLSFDGVDDTVEVPDDPSLNITEEITVEMWLYPYTPDENEGYCSKGLPGHGTPYQLYDGGVGPGFRVIDSGGNTHEVERGGHLSVEWHHMVGVYDLSDLILYLDGASAATNSIGDVTPLKTNNLSFYIGGYWSTDYLGDGKIAVVRIYNRALSAEEVQALYRNERISNEGLVLYLPLNAGSGDTAKDFSGQENNGTINGARWYGFRPVRSGGLQYDGVDDYCFSDDTEILTRSGWKLIKDITYDDEIASLNPKTEQIEYQKPSKLFNFEYHNKMCHFYGRHLDVLVTPDHNVYVSRYKSANVWLSYRLEQAEQVLNEFVRFKKDAKWKGQYQEYFVLPSIESNHRVGYPSQPPRKLPMDLWLHFFGWWLSEGSIKSVKNPKTQSTYYLVIISQTQDINSEKCKEIENTINELGWDWSYSGHNYHIWSGYNKQLVDYLKKFGKAGDKFIPATLKQLPPEQLEILYSALMKGDGHRNQFYTKSARLADDVQEICLKLGYSADVSYLNNRKYPIYVVGIEKLNTKPRVNEFRANRSTFASGKLADYNSLVFGITVPKYHIIYARRNGKGCWIGNCDCGSGTSLQMTDVVTLMAWIKAVDDGANHSVITRNYGFMINAPYSNSIEFFGHDGDDRTKCTTSWKSAWDNKWIHVVVVLRKYTGSWTDRGYVNGELVAESTDSAFDGPGQTGEVDIGSLKGSQRFFDGLIALVRIYNRALSDQEIADLYLGKEIDRTGLVLDMPMNEGQGSVAHDYSGEGNNGDINGARWYGNMPVKRTISAKRAIAVKR